MVIFICDTCGRECSAMATASIPPIDQIVCPKCGVIREEKQRVIYQKVKSKEWKKEINK